MTKKECETALSKLWDNTFGTDCITGEDLDKYVDVIDGLIQYVFNPQPYKFEELKKGMWVWYKPFKDCRKIREVSDNDKKFKWVEFEDGFVIEYEESQFFPVTKLQEY